MMDPEEQKKLGYALDYLWTIIGEEEILEEEVPQKFRNCKGQTHDSDCWYDFTLDFIRALKKGKTIDWPEKVK